MTRHLRSMLLAATMVAGFAAPALAAPKLDIVGLPDAQRPVAFDVVLPLRNVAGLESLLTQLHDEHSPNYHKWLTPAEFGLRFGPDAATVSSVTAALQAQGFAVKANTRSLRVTGPVAAVDRMFGTQLVLARSETGHLHVMSQVTPRMPSALAAAGAAVYSFTPLFKHTNSRVVTPALSGPDNRFGPDGGYYYTDLKQTYAYPANNTFATINGVRTQLNGTGVTLGVLMEGDVLDSDVKLIFDHENYSTTTGQPDPTLYAHVPINGGAPFDVNFSFEASLDTQSELTGAPGSHVILYNIPSLSDGDIFSGYVDIIEANKVDVVSSSFGGCELFNFPAYNGGQDFTGILKSEHELYMQGNSQGMTFLASSGDSAGRECPSPSYLSGGPKSLFKPGVESPSDDPNVTAVGGGNVITSYTAGSLDATYVGENAWVDPEIPFDPYGVGINVQGGYWGAGSGYSSLWAKPSYQNAVDTGSTKWRAVPDIGMQVGGCPGGISKVDPVTNFCNGGGFSYNGNGNADRSYFIIADGGNRYGVIGTSVSSPELAGAIATLIQLKGRMGNLNTYIYQLASIQAGGGRQYFHTGIQGYNGIEQTGLNSGYSLSYGVGSPIVNRFVGAKGDVAGTPQTITNP